MVPSGRRARRPDRAGFCSASGTRRADGVPQNDSTAVEWYRKAADQGHASAQSKLGWMYAQGRGVEQSDALAAEWYRKGAAQGEASAQNNLGLDLPERPRRRAERGARRRLVPEGRRPGQASAQDNLGGDVREGRRRRQGLRACPRVVSKGRGPGRSRWRKTAWVRCTRNGRGVEKSDALALEWYRKAADQGNAFAQAQARPDVPAGRGVEKNEALAVEWYRKAADQGDTLAQADLGSMYADRSWRPEERGARGRVVPEGRGPGRADRADRPRLDVQARARRRASDEPRSLVPQGRGSGLRGGQNSLGCDVRRTVWASRRTTRRRYDVVPQGRRPGRRRRADQPRLDVRERPGGREGRGRGCSSGTGRPPSRATLGDRSSSAGPMRWAPV